MAIRTWLFVPGHQPDRISKALLSPAGAVVLDLEDAVPANRKSSARAEVGRLLGTVPAGRPCWVRTQSTQCPEWNDDVTCVVRSGLTGLLLPKAEDPGEIVRAAEALDAVESAMGLAPGGVRLAALIETPLGVIRAPAMAAASSRMSALMFGAEDFSAAMGLSPVVRDELLYARSAVAVAAAAFGLERIDRVWTDLTDEDGLREDARRGRRLGFTGKSVIHPKQLEPVDQAFRPSADEEAWARRVLACWNQGGAAGALVVDGRMVDEPVVAAARRVLDELTN